MKKKKNQGFLMFSFFKALKRKQEKISKIYSKNKFSNIYIYIYNVLILVEVGNCVL